MVHAQLARRAFLALCLSAYALAACAQDKGAPPTAGFQPEVGQAGKDVVWVPTPQALVDKMLDMGKVTARDYVIDLGSGDGRTVITAAKRGATAVGIEYNPDMVAISEKAAAKEGVSERAKFMKADLYAADLSKATVITMFLLPEINLKLRPKLLDLKPGTRLVSNSFTMGEWQHDRSVNANEKEGCSSYCTAYLWIVPAKVDGTWKTGDGELVLKQTFQMLTGTLKTGGKDIAVKGRLNGDQIDIKGAEVQYIGRVSGDSIKGKSGSSEWTATRASAPATAGR
jgi:SAM-dependent methyltransferase